MKPEEQRIALAEADGWIVDSDYPNQFRSNAFTGEVLHVNELPNYLHDRNAMNEALQVLCPADRVVFGELLAAELGYDDDYYDGWNIGADAFFEALTAPLDKVSRAFLKTLGLWRE